MPRRTALLITSDDIGWYALRATLEETAGVRVLGATRCVREARAIAEESPPHVVFSALRGGEESVCPSSSSCSVAPALPPGSFSCPRGQDPRMRWHWRTCASPLGCSGRT